MSGGSAGNVSSTARRWWITLAIIAALSGTGEASGQEVGVHGWWIARDANGTRGLIGGGAYVAAAPHRLIDIRAGYAAARRMRAAGEQVICDSQAPVQVNCVSEPVQTESRLSNAELGVIAWHALSPEVRLGAGLSAIRHAVDVRDLGQHTHREYHQPIERPRVLTAGLSLHAQVAPRFSPDALVFGSIMRSSVDHGSCAQDSAIVCGRSGTASIRLGVAYRFGDLFGRGSH